MHRIENTVQPPALIIGFNRPEILSNLLDKTEFGSRTIYIAIDAPRDGIEEDTQLVEACKEIVKQFKLSRLGFKTELNFRSTNHGLRSAAVSAISWAFETEEKLIIIEDDVFPSRDYFIYMDYYLDRFQEDKTIWQVGGHNPNPKTKTLREPYLSIFPQIWGFGTWKDRWKLYDSNIFSFNDLSLYKLDGYIPHQLLNTDFYEYWENRILRIKNGFDTWDIQWALSMWREKAFSIQPNVNLTLNKGIGINSTNTRSVTVFYIQERFEHQKIKLITCEIKKNEFQDCITWKYVFGRSNGISVKWRIYMKFLRNLIKLKKRLIP